MARLERVDFPGAIHHVFGRGNAKNAIYRDDEDRSFFMRRIQLLRADCGIRLFAYCLMTNHYHLAIQTGQVPLQKVMHRLLTAYARVFNDRWELVGHPFQGRYQARLITTENDLRGVVRYIHQNPVEAGLTTVARTWAWSSHREIASGHSTVVDASFILELCGGPDGLEKKHLDWGGTQPTPSLDELARPFGGARVLRERRRSPAHLGALRAFAGSALESGYRQSEIARFLARTTAAVSLLLRRST